MPWNKFNQWFEKSLQSKLQNIKEIREGTTYF